MSKNILITKTLLLGPPSVQIFNTEINDNMFYTDCYIPGEGGIKSILSREHIDHILLFYSSLNDITCIKNRINAFISGSSCELQLNEFSDKIGESHASTVSSFIDSYIMDKAAAYNGSKKDAVKELLQLDTLQELYSEMHNSCNGLEISEDIKNYTKLYIYKYLPDRYKMFCREDNEKAGFDTIDAGSFIDCNAADLMILFKNSIMSVLKEGETANLIFFNYANKPSFDYIFSNVLKMTIEQNNFINLARHYGIFVQNGKLCVEDETDKYLIGLLADGMSAFTEYGKVDRIIKLISLGNITNDAVISLVYAMRTIDSGISLCDIDPILDGINEIKRINDQEHSFDNKKAQLFYNFIMGAIKESYAKLLEGDNIDYFELVKWAVSKRLYQQALTIIEAKMPEAFANKGIFYFYDEASDEEDLIEKFAIEYSYLKSYETYKMEHLDHYFIKTYLRNRNKKCKTDLETQKNFAKLRVSTIDGDDDTVIKAYTRCKDLAALEDALFGYYYIGQVRNKTNHADTRKSDKIELVNDDRKETEKMTMVLEALNYFIDKYEALLTGLDNAGYIRRDVNYSRMKARAGELKENRPR